MVDEQEPHIEQHPCIQGESHIHAFPPDTEFTMAWRSLYKSQQDHADGKDINSSLISDKIIVRAVAAAGGGGEEWRAYFCPNNSGAMNSRVPSSPWQV